MGRSYGMRRCIGPAPKVRRPSGKMPGLPDGQSAPVYTIIRIAQLFTVCVILLEYFYSYSRLAAIVSISPPKHRICREVYTIYYP